MNITWSWDEPEEDVKDDEIDYPECLAEDELQAEQEMQALDDDIEAKMQRKIDEQADQDYYAQCAAEGYVPGEHDRSCTCPECEGDPDGLGPQGQQAWNAFQRQEQLPWEERERLNDLERLAYCGYED